MAYKFNSTDEARAWLTERYERQCQLYPLTARIPLATYLRRNTRNAMLLTDDSDVIFEAEVVAQLEEERVALEEIMNAFDMTDAEARSYYAATRSHFGQ